MSRRIYVASSWRNKQQPAIVDALRTAGHEVYDFRNPSPGNIGFAWSEIDREWLDWTPAQFIEHLSEHPVAAAGYSLDKAALDWCDTCVVVLPCGRSAHLEGGYTIGQGKDTYFLLRDLNFEPELMYKLGTGCSTSLDEIIGWMAKRRPASVMRWHMENGGHFGRPANHALRLLREVVELCIASGAGAREIINSATAELTKAEARDEFGTGTQADIAEEWADCAMLLEVFATYAGIDRSGEIAKKLDVLWKRQWQADAGGALYRPGAV